MLYSKECQDLSLYRLSKAKQYLEDTKKTLAMEMYDTAANLLIMHFSMPLGRF